MGKVLNAIIEAKRKLEEQNIVPEYIELTANMANELKEEINLVNDEKYRNICEVFGMKIKIVGGE